MLLEDTEREVVSLFQREIDPHLSLNTKVAEMDLDGSEATELIQVLQERLRMFIPADGLFTDCGTVRDVARKIHDQNPERD